MELLILTSRLLYVCVLETNFTTTDWALSKKNRDTFTHLTVKVGAVGRGWWVLCGGRGGGEQSSSSVYDSVISTRIFKEVEVVKGGKRGGG